MTQQPLQKKALSKSTATPSSSEFLQMRPFAQTSKTETQEDLVPPNLQAQVERASRYGYSFGKLAIQPKLTIGEPGDKYEQEADRVAAQVVQRINQPDAVSSRQEENIQRVEKPEESEIQMKSLVQRREAIGGEEASTDLESAINSAKGGGQPLDAGLQRSMGQAMGADFSGVRVHTDAQSDQLNKSIQAKAFTTGQDVFFRQGVYEPESSGGQELIAHELTHVVQQKGGAVMRAPFPATQLSQHPNSESTVQLKPKNISNKHILKVDNAGEVTNEPAERDDPPVSYPLNLALTLGVLATKGGEATGGHLFKREYGGADDYKNVVTWSEKSEEKYTSGFEKKYLEEAKLEATGKGGCERKVETAASFRDFTDLDLNTIDLPDKEQNGNIISNRTIGKESKNSEGKAAKYKLTKLIKGAMESIPDQVTGKVKGKTTEVKWERQGKLMNMDGGINEGRVAQVFEDILDGVGETAQIDRAIRKIDTM
ncbi:MAG: DUF4157 domain-containing protein [Nostoc sp. DedQUE12b]|uniref:eCIS core domain-containing protein n=1 Tax=Nostoc sp. DedQUE12b TaxID=3075398 RepID=UPI002AD4BE8E|nr:DUF4157 domain-containing protein [Nostoc sp. DedQUE12b]MDZ8086063.1 DUF4157 domain-containing protein [Nostoc sp. DedQUE12b]